MPDADLNTTSGKPAIQIGAVPETIRVLKDEINNGALPEVYVTDGKLSIVEQVSGTANQDAGDRDKPLPVTSDVLTPPRLALQLAEHTYTYRITAKTRNKVTIVEETEVSPPGNALQAVLAGRTWPKVPPLRGIIGAPVLRGDGTLLQTRGYDERTGLYLAPNVELPLVPDAPTPEEVAECRSFLLDSFLHDFPWVSNADRANYIVLMVTPILGRYLRVLTPFGSVTATMPGSGKTILTSGPGLLYGQRVFSWTDSDEELRKTITSALATVEGTMIFDNLAEGTVINSAVLANLLTSPVWSDRLLGGNRIATAPNDRLWLATGNNLGVGGDMASRTVWVRIDPKIRARSSAAGSRSATSPSGSPPRSISAGCSTACWSSWSTGPAPAPRARPAPEPPCASSPPGPRASGDFSRTTASTVSWPTPRTPARRTPTTASGRCSSPPGTSGSGTSERRSPRSVNPRNPTMPMASARTIRGTGCSSATTAGARPTRNSSPCSCAARSADSTANTSYVKRSTRTRRTRSGGSRRPPKTTPNDDRAETNTADTADTANGI